MLVNLVTLLALTAAGALTGNRPPGPAVLAATEADSVRTAIEKDREDTRQWLKSAATSYLATIQRVDFDRRVLTVGRAKDNLVVLDDPAIAPHHLRVAVVGDSFR